MSELPSTPDYSTAKIAALYAQGLVDYLSSREINTDDLMPKPGASEGGNSTIEASLRSWIALLESAAETAQEPHLPALAGVNIQPRHLGPLGHVLMSCADLHEAYYQLARYIRLLGQIGQPELEVRGSKAHLLWRWPYSTPAPQVVAQFMLAARVRFMRWLTDQPQMKVDVNFHDAAPGPIEPFTAIFGGEVRFDAQDSEIVFPAEYLKLPVVTADTSFLQQAEQRAKSLLEELTGDSILVQTVKNVLVTRLSTGRVSLAETAEAMNISGRTLQRRLSEHNINYQEILDQVRSSCAGSLVRDDATPLAEVAFLLGYGDQSTFTAAYRRWFNSSPGQDRKKLKSEKP